jgi:predicted transcriptional regulator
MININSSAFFLPTKKFRRLTILLTMYHEPHLSQQAIAKSANLSSAMVNQYVKELARDKLIKVTEINKRDKDYSLTAKGRRLLFSLLMNCSAEIVQLYAQAKQELVEKLSFFFSSNPNQRIVLFGGAETAAMVIQAVHKFPHAEIIGIVDNDQSKWGQTFEGITIQSPDTITSMEPDTIIIASFARQDEIFASIQDTVPQDINIIKLSSL